MRAAAPVTDSGGAPIQADGDLRGTTPAEVVVSPAVSRARAVSSYVPFATAWESHCNVNLVAGDSVVTSAPMSWPLRSNWTPATAWSSTAVAVKVTVPVSVAVSAGA